MTTTAATVEHLNPEGLLHNPAFTEVVAVTGPVRTIYVSGRNVVEGFPAFQTVWGDRPNPPTITVAIVSGLANPECLAEINAVAVVPL